MTEPGGRAAAAAASGPGRQTGQLGQSGHADVEGLAAATRLLVIRHGQTEWNADGRMQGHRDIALNAQGLREAAALAPALAHESPAVVVSSDLSRAHQTARALAGPHGWPVHLDPAFRERSFGAFEGLTIEQIGEQHPDAIARWKARDPVYAPPGGGESLQAFQARVLPALERWLGRARGGLLIIVAHGGIADLVHRRALGLPLDMPRTWTIRNASIHRLLCAGDAMTVQAWDDTTHLDAVSRESLDEQR